MNSLELLAQSVLEKLDVVVFRRVGPRKYVFYGRPPAFYLNFFDLEYSDEPVMFWADSDMLDFFLHDAENYFSNPLTESSISSGIWHETSRNGQETSFLAQATRVDGEDLIIVRVLGEEYEEKMRILQKARENLLERRRLSLDLNEYKQRSRRDSLTGLFNRRTFDELLMENITLSVRTGANLSLIMVDIDNFKQVNDTYGHITGDKVLASLGQLLQSILRREDIPCRYGGEEFVVLAPYTTQKQIQFMAEKIRTKVETFRFSELFSITVSMGCSTYQPDESAENFIHRADIALYDAKRGGKNRIRTR